MTRTLLRIRFGLPPDPWAGLSVTTLDGAQAGELIRAAVSARLMVSILGPRGSGKTRSLRAALEGQDVSLVEPLRLDRERLHMGDIQTALVRELSDERPLRSGEARSFQTRRVLGAASRNRPVVLTIDDAHLLHPSTLRGLKRLRELVWAGMSPLLGIVLLGQRDRTEDVPEVALRSDVLRFSGLNSAEAGQALGQALNQNREVLDNNAAAALAASPRARNWLDLQALADECLAEAAARGEETITPEAAAVVLGTKRRQVAAAAPEAPDEGAVTDLLTQSHAGTWPQNSSRGALSGRG